MLALMCNELLYCRNVVREIEGNIEEGARQRGEKWALEAKQRNARMMQSRKRVELRNTPNGKIDDESQSRMTETPASMVSEEGTEVLVEKKPLGCIVRKPMAPGVIAPDALTENELTMSVEEYDGLCEAIDVQVIYLLIN